MPAVHYYLYVGLLFMSSRKLKTFIDVVQNEHKPTADKTDNRQVKVAY